VRLPLHPVHRERGVRENTIWVEDGKTVVYVSKADAGGLSRGDVVRLMGLAAVEVEEAREELVCASSDKKPKDKIQWIQDGVPCEVVKPESAVTGLCEKGCLSLAVGDLIQFERYGFVKLDKKEKERLVFYFAHR
jgi:glutamyl-tRNA synthetase